MKKIAKLIILSVVLLIMCGCDSEINNTNTKVYTTIYPIEYLTNYLYGTNSTVSSIYPKGSNVNKYELTTKQKDNYSKGNLFVYNGLTEEKELAREFLNKNPDLLLIDVSYGLNYEYAIEELWLSPNNFLMLAKNIRNNLIDYTSSTVIAETIEEKYREIEESLSFMDAELRNIATEAKKDNSTTLIVSSNKLSFLSNYGYDVIVLDDTINENNIEKYFDDGVYKDIYLCNNDEKTEFINKLVSKYEANIISVNTMFTITDEEVNNNDTYLTIMRKFIDNIRNTTLG